MLSKEILVLFQKRDIKLPDVFGTIKLPERKIYGSSYINKFGRPSSYIVAEHTGHSSQLFADAARRNAQFLPAVETSGLIRQVEIDLMC
jgi:hypothetical protein